MAEDTSTKPSEEFAATVSAARQRKKRKWDEPAESLISPGVAMLRAIPIGNGGGFGISVPGALPLANALATNTLLPAVALNAATISQKLNQSKAQDELIAREIVINDAEPTVRYKLTKRQTQEEIQKSTGAVVITRGKYRPPSALPDNEKPLYLHISAGSHLKDMAERILAVDRAASMVEEILKQGHNSLPVSGPYNAFLSNGQVNQPSSICMFLGFEPEPSLNIPARIRGPNDQYINHIINETGATVLLRGLGSGNEEISCAEDAKQPLHLYLSSINSKSLEAATNLAENLLDTISAECGASRVSSCKVYNAVPPPQLLLAGVENSENMQVSVSPVVTSTCTAAGSTQLEQSFASSASVTSSVSSTPGISMQNGSMACYGNLPIVSSYAYPIATGGTCYSGYGGIYPQATPLQQVALALKQAPTSATSLVATNSHTSSLPMTTSSSSADLEKRQHQRRKFQELPIASKGLNQNLRQRSECFKSGLEDATGRSLSSSPPKKLIRPGSSESPSLSRMMPPPMPKFQPTQLPIDSNDHVSRMMPPPPPKFPSPKSKLEAQNQNPVAGGAVAETPKATVKSSVKEKPIEPSADTLLKLVDYGEEEDDIPASSEESCRSDLMRSNESKPFWAV